LVRRYKVEAVAVREQLLTEQQGACACCGTTPALKSSLTVDWLIDPDDVNERGIPMCRGVTCRSCKIACHRVLYASNFTVQSRERLRQIQTYLDRPLIDPDAVLRRAGGMVQTKQQEIIATQHDAAMARADEMVDWLKEIGARPS
jgi:hypothetical protein